MAGRIVVNPNVCSGHPVIKGTRIMVRNILGMVAGGESVQDILRQFPELTEADVVAALKYAADVVDQHGRKMSRAASA